QALTRGAGAVLVQKGVRLKGAAPDRTATTLVWVKDTLKALGDLAGYHRLRFNIPVIAVTGSNGKTTTKDMIYHILSSDKVVLRNKGTENNNIGLPLTLLKLRPRHKAAVVELGTNHPGEIAQLNEIARPTIGVITNIGPAHLEFLKTIQGVAREKLSLLPYLKNGQVVLNGDDIEFNSKTRKFCINGKTINSQLPQALKLFFYSSVRQTVCAAPARVNSAVRQSICAVPARVRSIRKDEQRCLPRSVRCPRVRHCQVADCGIEKVSTDLNSSRFSLKIKKSFPGKRAGQYNLNLKTVGYHNILNAAAAFSVGLILGLKPEKILKRLSKFQQAGMRLCPRKIKGLLIIDDTYNANPASLEAGLRWLSGLKVKRGRKIVVCADMLELGTKAGWYHKETGKLIQTLNIDHLICYGQQAGLIAEAALKAGMDKNKLKSYLRPWAVVNYLKIIVKPGDVLFFKGSRSMQMERLKECFITCYIP
ncbi:MAG: UDP-N-acetylmuramoyl-tripeptide--D-alanyl-D-alanine ligase, partial [Candidatus Omnitrophica bacterium]|nr:UDP-N-acetylmuramoyl-tripeptide--D-alanyl-D-alanine ligase [Candidatus Omnitrophota bacterium]